MADPEIPSKPATSPEFTYGGAPDDVPGNGPAALWVLLACLALGALAGWQIGATRASTGDFLGTEWATMTEQPLTGADKAFNWLLFCMFACTGIIASSVVYLAGKINRR